jgi:hypothetical protein
MSDWKSSSWESADSASKMSSVSKTSGTKTKTMGTKTKTMGTKTKTISTYCWSSNSTYSWGSNSGDSWGSMGNVGNGADGNSWLSNGVDNLMGFVVGAGLVDWLVDLDFSGDWSNDGLLSENGLFSKNWASCEGLGDDWSWLDGSDGSWLMDMGVFSNWDSLVSDLWCNFSECFSSLYSVGEVSSQSVVSN